MSETEDYDKSATIDLEGLNSGDIIRWNEVSGAWESMVEPLVFKGIVLIPMSEPAGVEGTVYYKAADNSVYVAIE